MNAERNSLKSAMLSGSRLKVKGLARKLGVSPSRIIELYYGYSPMKVHEAEILAEVCGATPEYWLELSRTEQAKFGFKAGDPERTTCLRRPGSNPGDIL